MYIKRVRKSLLILMIIPLIDACQSTAPQKSTFDANYSGSSVDLIFTSPNFSAPNMPPLMSGYAYVESFDRKKFCAGSKEAISKVSVTRKNKTQHSKLPSGSIVVNVGYYAMGGGGLKGKAYYAFDVNPLNSYKITLTEARPFVTSYSVKIEEKNPKGVVSVPTRLKSGVKNICSS